MKSVLSSLVVIVAFTATMNSCKKEQYTSSNDCTSFKKDGCLTPLFVDSLGHSKKIYLWKTEGWGQNVNAVIKKIDSLGFQPVDKNYCLTGMRQHIDSVRIYANYVTCLYIYNEQEDGPSCVFYFSDGPNKVGTLSGSELTNDFQTRLYNFTIVEKKTSQK